LLANQKVCLRGLSKFCTFKSLLKFTVSVVRQLKKTVLANNET